LEILLGSIVRGIYYNPTLTALSASQHIAVHNETGDNVFNSTSGGTFIGYQYTNYTSSRSAGFKLDVSGSTRINGAAQITGSLILTGSLSMSLQTGTPVSTLAPIGYYRATINGAAVFIPFYV
jgi:hypothetical protein